MKETSVCVVNDAGKVILEQPVPTEPADIIALLTSLGVPFDRIGIETGPLSQRLVNALTAADLPVICVETRHMKALLTAQHQQDGPQRCARELFLRSDRPIPPPMVAAEKLAKTELIAAITGQNAASEQGSAQASANYNQD